MKKIRVKTNVSNFAIIEILSQSNEERYWRSMTFWSRKMISTKQHYETHDQKLLTIVAAFKQWRHYLKDSVHIVKMWSNHNNLREFMKQSELNVKQARWALKLAAYDFEIHHRVDKNNSTNESSRRLDYEKISLNNIILLSTLQNKLLLTNKELSLKRRNSTNVDSLSIINVVTNAID